MNQYDEIKRLLENSRSMLGKSKLDETRETLIQKGIIQEAVIPNDPTNIEKDIEVNIDNETEPQKDKTQAYRVSGGILKMHGKDQKELELTTDEKVAFQETMDEFVSEVSDLVDFGPLNVYKNSVEWSGKIIDATAQDKSTVALRDFNQKCLDDVRVEKTLLPLRDGLLILRKK
jgi:hypothetical protein